MSQYKGLSRAQLSFDYLHTNSLVAALLTLNLNALSLRQLKSSTRNHQIGQ